MIRARSGRINEAKIKSVMRFRRLLPETKIKPGNDSSPIAYIKEFRRLFWEVIAGVVVMVNVTPFAGGGSPALICDGLNEQLLRGGRVVAEQKYVTAFGNFAVPAGSAEKVSV
jgi:hypothetical protein